MNPAFSLRRIAPAPVSAAILGLALPVSAGGALPVRGRADETIPDVAPAGPGLRLLTVEGSGEATDQGRFTSIEAVIFDVGDGTFAGTHVFTAANGDRLHADVGGAFTSATTAGGTFMFTGGTGRFRNASGEASFRAVTPDGIDIALTSEGTVRF